MSCVITSVDYWLFVISFIEVWFMYNTVHILLEFWQMYTILVTSNPTKMSAIPRIPFSLCGTGYLPPAAWGSQGFSFPYRLYLSFLLYFWSQHAGNCKLFCAGPVRSIQCVLLSVWLLSTVSLRLSSMTVLIVYFVSKSFLFIGFNCGKRCKT